MLKRELFGCSFKGHKDLTKGRKLRVNKKMHVHLVRVIPSSKPSERRSGAIPGRSARRCAHGPEVRTKVLAASLDDAVVTWAPDRLRHERGHRVYKTPFSD